MSDSRNQTVDCHTLLQSSAALHHSSLVPNLTKRQAFAQEPWIRNTPEAVILEKTPSQLIYFYQISHISVKEKFIKKSKKYKNTYLPQYTIRPEEPKKADFKVKDIHLWSLFMA
jgi:hypothetical protein